MKKIKKLTLSKDTIRNLELVTAGVDNDCWSAHTDCPLGSCGC